MELEGGVQTTGESHGVDGSDVLYKLDCVCDEVGEQRVKTLDWKVGTRKYPIDIESSTVMRNTGLESRVSRFSF